MWQPINTESRWKRLLYFDGPVLFYAGLIFWLSSQSFTEYQKGWIERVPDDIPHALEYTGLTLLVFRQWWASHRIRNLWIVFVLTFLLSVGYGATDEWHQSFVPDRNMDFQDLVADALGSLIGLMLMGAYLLKKKKLTLSKRI